MYILYKSMTSWTQLITLPISQGLTILQFKKYWILLSRNGNNSALAKNLLTLIFFTSNVINAINGITPNAWVSHLKKLSPRLSFTVYSAMIKIRKNSQKERIDID